MAGGEPLDIKSTEPSDIKKAAIKREKLLKGVNRVVWRENEIKLFSDFLGDDGKIVFGDDFYVSYSPAENGVFVTELLCGGTYENALDVLKKRVKIRFCLCAGGKSRRIKKLQTHRRRYDKKYQRREDK